jgi:hypothetical protein
VHPRSRLISFKPASFLPLQQPQSFICYVSVLAFVFLSNVSDRLKLKAKLS